MKTWPTVFYYKDVYCLLNRKSGASGFRFIQLLKEVIKDPSSFPFSCSPTLRMLAFCLLFTLHSLKMAAAGPGAGSSPWIGRKRKGKRQQLFSDFVSYIRKVTFSRFPLMPFWPHMGHLITLAAQKPGSSFFEPLQFLTRPHLFISGNIARVTCHFFWPQHPHSSVIWGLDSSVTFKLCFHEPWVSEDDLRGPCRGSEWRWSEPGSGLPLLPGQTHFQLPHRLGFLGVSFG